MWEAYQYLLGLKVGSAEERAAWVALAGELLARLDADPAFAIAAARLRLRLGAPDLAS